MHNVTYSIEGMMATMMLNSFASFRYKGEPIADSEWLRVAWTAQSTARRLSSFGARFGLTT
jgi:hypothetical protein